MRFTTYLISLAKRDQKRRSKMGMVMDTKKLSEDIITSHDVRGKAINELVANIQMMIGDTHRMIRAIQTDHKKMADSLRASLEKGETGRAKDFRAMMGNIRNMTRKIQTRRGEIHKEVHGLLQEFKAQREEMASIWRRLSETMSKKKKRGLAAGKPEEITKSKV